jgi:4,5-dihydroxyphthalate decarboxylase
MSNRGKLALQTMLGNYPNTAALKEGRLRSELIDFDFADVKVANNHFKQIVREAKYDMGELAIATYLQARSFDKPYVLLPAVLVSRGQHHTIAYNAERGPLSPSDLAGRRVGVRAYTVTTVTWVRGMLADEYGLDLSKVDWVTFEDPHVAEYQDPKIARRAPPGKELVQMLLDGEIDAAVVGDKLPDPRLKHLVPDHEAAAQRWAQKHGGVPINHMVVVRSELSKSRPDVVQEVFRLLRESKSAAGAPKNPEPLRFGVEACRPVIEAMIGYCHKQGLIPKPLSVDSLFDDVTRKLGA